jgi:hypothetical protein
MEENDKLLQHFTDRIMRIDPSMANLFGQGFPGMQGSTAITGSSGSAAETIGQLRKATSAFIHEYKQDTPRRATLLKVAEYIEAPLNILQTLSILTIEETDGLLNEMHNLIDRRAP